MAARVASTMREALPDLLTTQSMQSGRSVINAVMIAVVSGMRDSASPDLDASVTERLHAVTLAIATSAHHPLARRAIRTGGDCPWRACGGGETSA
jgi:hypothetical protein